MKCILLLIVCITTCYSITDNNIICGKGKKAIIKTKSYYRRRRSSNKKVNIICETCPINTYQPFNNINVEDCAKCRGGQLSESGSEICTGTLCERGYFAPDSNSQNCIKCPKGKYQNKNGEFKCEECPSGMWQPNIGAIDCIGESNICKPGNYGLKGSDIQLECKECPRGKYTNNPGSDICMSCVDSYQPFSGKSECLEYPSCHMDQYRKDNSPTKVGSCENCVNISNIHKTSFWIIIGSIIFLIDYLFIMCYTSLHKKNLCSVIYSTLILIPLITFVITIGNCNNKKQSKYAVQNIMITTMVLVSPVIINIGFIFKSSCKR